ncbi:MAG: FKBP-type peptidyl-prolyl cis-trans isomerase [Clostridiales bacterium]|nr:FKBP-type peptidyl-prolyl cis-trans isomerase [Candidatus Equinaster intestinalis]
MKRIIALALSLVAVCTLFASCKKEKTGGTKDGERKLYNYDLSQYVTLGDYKGIEVDTSSETFQNYKESFFKNDVSNANLYIKRTTGKVEKGDLTNFDYNGKKKSDGTAIDSNTTDLVVGSGQFIPGFEDNLIGKNVGDLFEFDITFPENYGDPDLNGQLATFTIKINYVSDIPEKNDEFAKKLGYDNLEAYDKALEKQVVKELVAVELFTGDKCAIKSYPETEKKRYDDLYDYYINYANEQVKTYTDQGQTMDVDTILYTTLGKTADGLKEFYQNTLKREIITYAIFDAEKLSYTDEAYQKELEAQAQAQGVTVEEFEKQGDLSYIESTLVLDAVFDYLYTVAKIK